MVKDTNAQPCVFVKTLKQTLKKAVHCQTMLLSWLTSHKFIALLFPPCAAYGYLRRAIRE